MSQWSVNEDEVRSVAYVVRANWHVQPGNESAVLEAVRFLAPLSREEPGNRYYQAYQDVDEPGVIRLFEVYDDEAAYLAHVDSAHFKQYAFDTAIPLLAERERHFYLTID